MPDIINSPIPPGPDGGCPEGYVLSQDKTQCYYIGVGPPLTNTGASLPEVDPRNAGELTGLGTGDSGLAERQALAHWHALKKSAPTAMISAAKGAHFIGEILGDLLSP